MENDKLFNRLFNAFILVGMFVAVGVLNASEFTKPGARPLWLTIATIGALAGVVNVVLSAKGSIWNYLFGLVDVLAMTAVTLESSLHNQNPTWGLFIIHAAFLLPMQFVGIWQWRRRGATSRTSVHARRLKWWQWLCTLAFIAVCVPLLYGAFSGVSLFAGNVNRVVLFDTIVTSLVISAQILMALAFADQWVLWITVNLCSIALFWFKSHSASPDSYTVVYMLKYVFYFINSLNGLRIWLKLSRS